MGPLGRARGWLAHAAASGGWGDSLRADQHAAGLDDAGVRQQRLGHLPQPLRPPAHARRLLRGRGRLGGRPLLAAGHRHRHRRQREDPVHLLRHLRPQAHTGACHQAGCGSVKVGRQEWPDHHQGCDRADGTLCRGFSCRSAGLVSALCVAARCLVAQDAVQQGCLRWASLHVRVGRGRCLGSEALARRLVQNRRLVPPLRRRGARRGGGSGGIAESRT
mmetsp:Transcript_158024/g.506849  ORF Transcript_158024/g.506849 Transcript_158024/m.506849 type:complete len:219 (+) Transcript_158024:622-1278(+)